MLERFLLQRGKSLQSFNPPYVTDRVEAAGDSSSNRVTSLQPVESCLAASTRIKETLHPKIYLFFFPLIAPICACSFKRRPILATTKQHQIVYSQVFKRVQNTNA